MSAIQIVAAPRDSDPPFPIDAEVLEEDTYLVLSAPPVARATREPPRQLLSRARRSIPRAPGTALVRPGSPARILAIVHDLEREPSWTEAWVRQALEAALELAGRHGLGSIGVDLLATRHGSLAQVRFVELLQGVVSEHGPTGIERIWLRLPTSTTDAALVERVRELGWGPGHLTGS